MLERKRIECRPDQEFEYRDILYDFGWDLESRQEVHYSDTRVKNIDIYSTSYGGRAYVDSETSSGSKVILIFVRDTNMKNYYKIKELEMEFERKGGYRSLW